MKLKLAGISILTAAALAIAPVSPASAHGFHHHGFPIIAGLIGAGVAVGTAAAVIATAPVRVIANAAPPYPAYYPGYAYAPAAYAAPVYYAPAPQPVYYQAPVPYYPAYGYAR